TINLSLPLSVEADEGISESRTQQFQIAFLQIQNIKEKALQSTAWATKYNAWKLGGSDCVKLYYYEGLMAYEYEQNPVFKTFVDQSESDITVFKNRGFSASRKAINLLKQMENKCSVQARRLKKKEEKLKDLPFIYQKMGIVLGYFDEKGNMLKPLITPDQAGPSAEELAIIDNLKKTISNLPAVEKLQAELKVCEEDIKNLLAKLNPVEHKQSKFKQRLKKIAGIPRKLLSKVAKIKEWQERLKAGKDKVPLAGRLLAKVGGLIGKTTFLGNAANLLVDGAAKLDAKLASIDKKIKTVRNGYESAVANLEKNQAELLALINEKTGLTDRLGQPINDLEGLKAKVVGFAKRYQLFDEKDKCLSTQELTEKIAGIEKEQTEVEPVLENLETDVAKAEVETTTLETETTEIEAEIDRENAAKEEIQGVEIEEQKLEADFGKKIKLNPVKVEEWADNFEVERPYWGAVFHPDNEVVKGYVGKYFQIQLKDAQKNVKLLFGPGEYFMEKTTFRENYGATIGAFVVEALRAMKKSDMDKVKLFVQGSADITGNATFKGKMDDSYLYESVEVLPQNADKETFANIAKSKSIALQNFRNSDLPDLRGNYLKEMISVYSKKLKPILLEGEVKQVKGEGERNAVIYLFIPAEILE
ncbi:MAG: hypothetical protein AAGJ18_16035, partial [Bacteroidota bacterium]